VERAWVWRIPAGAQQRRKMKNSPMQGIKYGLAFVFGAIYASCWWAILSFQNQNASWLILPVMGMIFGSLAIMFGVTCFFADHW